MTTINISRAATLFAAALACLLHVTPVHAQSNRTFVSSSGNDVNACTIAAPCRTLQAAFNVTAAGGEIQVLDATGYGTLNITHSISIEGHGWASMNGSPGDDGITINAAQGDIVVLRGLILEGYGRGGSGIVFNTGATLDVSDCIIRGFRNGALSVTATTPAKLFVTNTHIFNNGAGIALAPFAVVPVNVALRHVSIEGNASSAVEFDANSQSAAINLTVIDSELSRNGSGVFDSHIASSVIVQNSTMADNANGVVVNAGSGAVVRVSRSTITGNQNGFFTLNGGQISSYGDNNLLHNGVDGAPTATIPYH
jgi:hypothetical protein